MFSPPSFSLASVKEAASKTAASLRQAMEDPGPPAASAVAAAAAAEDDPLLAKPPAELVALIRKMHAKLKALDEKVKQSTASEEENQLMRDELVALKAKIRSDVSGDGAPAFPSAASDDELAKVRAPDI